MPDISLSRQTQLRGRPLQDAVSSMIHDLSGQSPYNMVEFGWRWINGAQIGLDAPGHMSGTVDIRDGSPSTVSVQMDLLSALARGQRARVIRDMNAQADRFLTGSAPQVDDNLPPPPEATEQESRRGEFNWNLFGQIFQNITTGVAGGLNAMNEAVAQTTAEQALEVASDAANGKQVFDGGVLYTKPTDVTQTTPATPASAPPPVLAQQGMPTWGWWALGIGGVTAVGLTIWWLRQRGE